MAEEDKAPESDSASLLVEHAKVVERLDRLSERIGELRRHL